MLYKIKNGGNIHLALAEGTIPDGVPVLPVVVHQVHVLNDGQEVFHHLNRVSASFLSWPMSGAKRTYLVFTA